MRRAIVPALVLMMSSSIVSAADSMSEARDLRAIEAKESGRASYSPQTAVKFKENYNVYMKNALAVDFTKRKATVTLPMWRGLSPKGENVYYIITESSDFEVAKTLGINFSPKLKHGVGTAGAQKVTIDDGVIKFKGSVDFAPVHKVSAGSAAQPFPPDVIKPGAVADMEWSSLVVLPSGTAYNIQLVRNASGDHDRVKDIDVKKMTVTLSILDGFQGGKRLYYHLVTDASADLAAALEKGVYAPKLGLLPEGGKSAPSDKSALLAFSPVLNGITDIKTNEEQGFAASIANDGIDPINIFPIDPDNENSSDSNNYSPMWDAHVSMWTPEAIKDGKRRRIESFEDLQSLVSAGMVTSAMINPPGPGNPFVFGLRPTRAIINCPVIAQPELGQD